MVSIAISWIAYHILTPLVLISSVIFRYNAFSAVYLILLLVYPYRPSLMHSSKAKCASFALTWLITSTIFILAQMAFQIALLAKSPYGSLVGEICEDKERVLRYIGFERLDKMSVANVFRFLLPDVIGFIVAVLTFVLIKKTTEPSIAQQTAPSPRTEDETTGNPALEESTQSEEGIPILRVTSTALKNASLLFATMIVMAIAGIANPSLFSAVYLIMFMILMTTWSLHGRLVNNAVAILRIIISFVAAVQLLLLFFYQMDFFRQALPSYVLAARLMGFTPFVNTDCSLYPYDLVLNYGLPWFAFVSPPVVFAMYWMLALGARVFFASDQSKLRPRGDSDGTRRRRRKKDERMVQRSKVIVVDIEKEAMNMQPLVHEEEIPQQYDSINNIPSTSAQPDQDIEDKDAKTITKQGYLHILSDWISSLKHQSFYVVVLIVMMAWSVTFHSWLTLILLVWSCILWLLKDRSWGTLICSPAITIYAMLLICLQFAYSMDLTEEELPTSVQIADNKTLNLSSFGMVHFYDNDPCLFLGAQILYTCVFWIVLHQFVFIRRQKYGAEQAKQSDEKSWFVDAGLYAKEKLSKYWILLVYGFLLIICVEGQPSGIKMIYALFFTLNAFLFEISWGLWHRTLSLFLLSLVFYTMIVVLLVYTFQFDEFPGYWKSFTNFSNEQLADLGLIKYDGAGELLLRICIPTLFLLVVILQKHYFHERFLQLIHKRIKIVKLETRNHEPEAVETSGGSNEDGESIEMQDLTVQEKPDITKKELALQCAKKAGEIFLLYWYGLVRFVWRVLEFHIWKLLIITVLVTALQKATAVRGIMFVTWVVFVPIRSCRLLLYVITCGYVGLVLLGSMFYQLDFISEARGHELYYNCSVDMNSTGWSQQYDLVEWFGFSKMTSDSFFHHSQGYITILIMLAFERIIMRRQDWRRYYHREKDMHPQLTVLYPSITWHRVDDAFIPCGKYILNYWFYKFGVEACFIMAVITIWMRADFFAVIYSVFFLIILGIKTRRNLSKFWPFYCIFLLVILVAEYVIALGMPPIWCTDHEYPWTTLAHTTEMIRDRLIRWLYLPDYIIPPYSTSLVVDVFQLLFVVCQLFVFQFEMTPVAQEYGGDNKYLTPQQLDEITPATNTKPNFMMKKSRNVLDQVKVAVFKYSFWVTSAIIFIAGTSRISLFCMGYLMAFFYLLSLNQSLLMGKPSRLLHIWNIVLGYNVGVIVLKISLQIASCVYIDILEQRACVFVQLMSLVCARPEAYRGLTESLASETCATPDNYTNAGLTWDFVCFLFLIIQRRIFNSYYFLHVAEDLRISMKLASRGAELFEEKLICEVNDRKKSEETGISQIKESMDAIQMKYANMKKGHWSPETHTDAMRSGDYYMFEDDAEKEEEKKKEKDILNPLQMLHVADTAGIDKALEEREEDKKLLEEGEDHMPVPKETLRGKSTEDLSIVDEMDGEVEEEEPEGKRKKNVVVQSLKFVWELFLSLIDTVILWLNTVNCDYRNVALRLSGEKDELTKLNVSESPRPESTQITIDPPQGDAKDQAEGEDGGQSSTDLVPVNGNSQSSNETLDSQKSDLEPIDFDKDQMRLFRLFYAIWYTIISRTDVVCYMLVILNLMLTASVLSLVLPLAIFLWASLSTPRPTSRFWNFCIVYLEVVIMIKFLFQFEFFPWNADATANLETNDPFWWPRIIGIEQKHNWSALDLAQLLAFFFHRSILKVHGLWDRTGKKEVEETETTENEEQPENEHVSKEGGDAHDETQVQSEHDGEGEDGEQKKVGRKERLKRVASSPWRFYQRVIHQEFSAVTDVYIYIFLCDVINFVIIIFGYWAFGKYATEAADVVSSISSNKVPTGFLVMLLIQFAMMFIDRALYLRKNLVGKMVFQFCLVIGVHVWMFFILPAINERPFYMNGVAQTWYFFKAVYFLLSAYQIRCGYPTRVLGNFLTKAYGTANLFLFKGYRIIPFLAELTAVMDWMFIETTMGVGEWFKFQSIYAEVFELQCWRVFEKNYPSPRTQPKSKLIKYFVGGLLVFFLVAIIWFPLLFMNIVLTIGGLTNNPVQVSVQISIGTFEPLLQVIADSDAITPWTEAQFNAFSTERAADPSAAVFLSAYEASQVVTVHIDGESKTEWAISPPQQEKLLQKLSASNPNSLQFDFEWNLIRNSERTSVVSAVGSSRLFLENGNPARTQLFTILNDTAAERNPATIKNLFPKYVYSGAKSISTAAERLYGGQNTSDYSSVNLTLRSDPLDASTTWWRVVELDGRDTITEPSIELVVFSDKVSPASLSFLVSYGIIGLYVSIVLVVGKLVRGALVGSTSSIMFMELPRMERVLHLCLDIFLVREEKQYQLEEDLYAKLIFLYRSPQTMIRWTRPKQD